MGIKQSTWIAIGLFGVTGIANADIADFDDPGIFSPFNNAQVDVVWVGSNAGYTGELNWYNPEVPSSPITMWTNKSATDGQRFVIPRIYAQGERVDFSYEIIHGRHDVFSTANEEDWSQFETDASNPLDVLVGVEDIRFPMGDMDHNDAVFRVLFSESNVPAPGAYALLVGGCLLMARRRR